MFYKMVRSQSLPENIHEAHRKRFVQARKTHYDRMKTLFYLCFGNSNKVQIRSAARFCEESQDELLNLYRQCDISDDKDDYNAIIKAARYEGYELYRRANRKPV